MRIFIRKTLIDYYMQHCDAKTALEDYRNS